MLSDHKIFCAIDTDDYEKAHILALTIAPYSKAIKLGLTFFNKNGADGVRKICDAVNAVSLRPVALFLDLKLHDIPMQVAGAIRAIIPLQPYCVTIHTSGGLQMMKEAMKAANEEAIKLGVARPKIIGITVLTSLDSENLSAVGQDNDAQAQVIRLAKLAQDAGLDGVVCSPQEVAALRPHVEPHFELIVPGVRPAGSDKDDQKRTMRPAQAIEAGANHLVIGRPITQSEDPIATLQYIQTEIERSYAA